MTGVKKLARAVYEILLRQRYIVATARMVVMSEYLKTPKQNASKPRIISEVKKNCLSKLKLNFTPSLQDFGKSKFSGQLLWKSGSSQWVLRGAEVRQGTLILMNKESLTVELSLPLRELNLRACNAPRTFCLAESKGLRLLVFQALTEEDYEKWVRILAVELIRQTPFQNVRFLDILSIIRNKESDGDSLRRGRSEESVTKPEERFWGSSMIRCCSPPVTQINENAVQCTHDRTSRIWKTDGGRGEEDLKKIAIKIKMKDSMPLNEGNGNKKGTTWLRTQSMNNLANSKETSDESGISSCDEIPTDSACRNVEDFSFLSVRERKKFFESLNSENDMTKSEPSSPLARSSSIGNIKSLSCDRYKLRKRKRTKSLHDLHKTPVREMCQLFESQDRKLEKTLEDDDEIPETNAMVLLTQRRLQKGERKLEKLKNQINEVEENITIISDDLRSIANSTVERKGLDLFKALQRRLDEENSRLDRLKEETLRVIKGNRRVVMKLEKCTDKSQSETELSSS